MTAIGVIVALIVAVVGVAAGYFIGYNNRKKTAEAQIGSAEAEATRLVNEAIKAADSADPAAVLAALPGVTYEGVCGQISFNEVGDANRDAAYIKTANTSTTNWDFVKVQGVEQQAPPAPLA